MEFKNSLLNVYRVLLEDITIKVDALEKLRHNLGELKIKELNILRGKKLQLIECIEIIETHNL
jgi:hypothetical protein